MSPSLSNLYQGFKMVKNVARITADVFIEITGEEKVYIEKESSD